MDTPALPATPGMGSRRNEDIALDLLKFIAAHSDVAKAGASVGFQQATAKGADDATERLLDLYGKCLSAVQGSRK